MITGNSEVEEFFETRRVAQQSKDIDRLMRHYSPGIGYYDAISPLLFRDTDEVRRTFIRWFDGYDGPIRLKTHECAIVTNGDIAFANMPHLQAWLPSGLDDPA